MRIPGLKQLRLSALRLRSRLVDGALILGYHRIAEAVSDPFSLAVSPEHFAEQLTFLRDQAYPMSLQKLVQFLEDGKVPRRAVVITFDDGYADNLHIAKPLLERYEIPATVFITTGYLGREFWWDELARIILAPSTVPRQLSLPVAHSSCEWTPSGTVPGSDDTPELRRELLNLLYQRLRPVCEREQRRALNHLAAWAGLNAKGKSSDGALSVEEVVRLAEGRLVEIGAHTVTHPVLAELQDSSQRFEIQESKLRLEELLSGSVTAFSYPNGSASKVTLRLVRETGFTSGCASGSDTAWSGSDRFRLPRFWVPNWDGNRFSCWMARWLRA